MSIDVAKLIQLRKFFAGLVGIYLIWTLHFLLLPIAIQEELLSVVGTTKDFKPMYRNKRITGYQLVLDNDHTYTLKWLDFNLDKTILKKIAESKVVTISYQPKCYGYCGNQIYEIATENSIILGYSFLQAMYIENENKQKALIPYIFSFLTLSLLITHILIKAQSSRALGRN